VLSIELRRRNNLSINSPVLPTAPNNTPLLELSSTSPHPKFVHLTQFSQFLLNRQYVGRHIFQQSRIANYASNSLWKQQQALVQAQVPGPSRGADCEAEAGVRGEI
jgi:hypothetical protein